VRRLFTTARSTTPAPAEAKVVPFLAPRNQTVGYPVTAAQDATKATEAVARSVWAFAAARAIAWNGARIPAVVRRGDPVTGSPIRGHELLPILNQRANPLPVGSALEFRIMLAMQVLLLRKGAFIEVQRDGLGAPVGLYLLPPYPVTKPIPDRRNFVSRYEVRLPGYDLQTVNRDNVVWVKYPHPTDPYDGMPPMDAAGLSMDTDYLARLFNRNFLLNDGGTSGIISVDGQIDPDGEAELQARFGGGVTRAGRWTVVAGGDVRAQPLTTTPRDAQHVQTMDRMGVDVSVAFGVPKSIMGDASGRTYDNASTERDIFWTETVDPFLDFLGNALDVLDGDPRSFVRFDTSEVKANLRSTQETRKIVLAEFMQGVWSMDETRTIAGGEPLGTERSEKHYAPTVTGTAVEDEPQAPPAGAPPIPGQEGQPPDLTVIPGGQTAGHRAAGEVKASGADGPPATFRR
jgi:HK97 family phage portal protein